MTEAEAKKYLESCGAYYEIWTDGKSALLDGYFTAKELECIVCLMQIEEERGID